NSSAPTDYIAYSVSGSKLTITGQPGDDTIRITDLGGGKIELFRSGIDTDGKSHNDPVRIFTGITDVEADLGDGDDTFTMDRSLTINATVHGGKGKDSITTGAGNDLITGDDDDDLIDAGDGTNEVHGGSGKDIIYGGSGKDTIFGDDGNDFIDGGAGDDEL